MKISKKAIAANAAYNRATATTIWEAYENPSYEKEKAYNRIYDEMRRLGGQGLAITGKSCFFFSCAYVLGDKLIYHTYANCYEYPRIVEA